MAAIGFTLCLYWCYFFKITSNGSFWIKLQDLLFEYEDKAAAEEKQAISFLSEAAEENTLISDSLV